MNTEELTLEAPDGKQIFVYHWAPDDPSAIKGAVQIAHGLGEHAGRYAHVGAALAAAGYDVWAPDHRGHGRTAEGPEELGFFAEEDGWAKLVGDTHLVNRHIAKLHRNLPICLLGHSLGGLVAQDYLGTHPDALDAVILSGTTMGGGALAHAGRLITRMEAVRQGKRGRSKLSSGLVFDAYNKQFKPNRTRFDWLSRDEAAVDAYVADPLCGFDPTNQAWVDVSDAVVSLGRRGTFAGIPKEMPIYVISGTEDPESGNTKTLRALLDQYRKVGLTRVAHRFYEGARHELFNETNRDEVLADLVAWLDENLAAGEHKRAGRVA